MTRYNRSFLVPYLEKICALHFAKRRLFERQNWLSHQVRKFREGLPNPVPRKPALQKPGWGAVVLFGLAVIFSWGFIDLVKDGTAVDSMVSFFAVMGIAFWILGFWRLSAVRSNNNKLEFEYEQKMKKYEQTKRYNEAEFKKAAPYEKELQNCRNEIVRVENLLNRAYSANVVPGDYRDMYAAVYLYRWFSTGASDDMDHALSMYVLEEIKDRLDTVISNQSQQLLNEQIMIANQYNTMEKQKVFQSNMLSKLDSIQATEEERLRYTKMISCDTETMAFFATSEYIRRI